ncbi:murein DD-endopeptidase MepM/ murein hydrolase activator NlpD [Paenibacillus endophyticus]|uniref:Murein DD-endopeptidase MepM/ murein hydrolase activator NlpD n=1 Tax=Paenibacillus endophyticus TaxID=1294268 RepID=A0A7W5C4A0_9BACL|nr:M23 family metallopeptidase [Paenibacillus endophyticus]MBB3150963.1 murein DD-endopeptidase MepM/ murein hydrolase activator NlpD [Paenibacillus endophyticus]
MKKGMKQLLYSAAVFTLLTAAPSFSSAASYTVQPSDTLWIIGSKHSTTVQQLKKQNGLTSDSLVIGQKLLVPDPPEFVAATVLQGDTLWKIAKRSAIPLPKLIAANPQLPNPNNIWAGLDIRIPKLPGQYANGVFPLPKGTYTPFSNTYADARTWSTDGSEVRSHEGVDILAPKGTAVYSALPGTIVNAGWNEYGGWRVTVRVDAATTFYYAHLSKYAAGIKEGAKVSAGQLLGYVGSTGYGPEGTEGKFVPHLHFGVYKSSPSYHSIDPYLMLKWWSL